ncbi:hypothetical protein D8674_014197 [Pyrus ussuriensis x Pyrus communis]|uniref:Uncharacterized protein n=1 Tax=Pyrus ussuriensis x Pyrus communis TaxID=2448454 RepID=A0A5N5GSR5_9ROSA|nr:hypothetical protein D8674_014197 [Pyrus ussuriensis x Pyrus communis]
MTSTLMASITDNTNVDPESLVVLGPSATHHSPKIPNYGHMWHPDSYRTQLRNGSLIIAVNGLSLRNDWCDPRNLPPWAFTNAEEPIFSILDCYLLGVRIEEVIDPAQNAVSSQNIGPPHPN